MILKWLKKDSDNKWKLFQLTFGFLISLFVILQAIQFIEFREDMGHVSDMGDINSQVVEELGIAKKFLISFGSDLNQIRQFLLLPTKEYAFEDLGNVEIEDKEDLTTQIFTFVNELGEFEAKQKKFNENLEALKADLTDPLWTKYSLVPDVNGVEGVDGVSFPVTDLSSGEDILIITLSYDGEFSVLTYNKELILADSEAYSESLDDINDFVVNFSEEVRTLVKEVNAARYNLSMEIFVDQITSSALEGLRYDGENADLDRYFYDLLAEDGRKVGEIQVSKENADLVIYSADLDEKLTFVSAAELADGISKIIDKRTSLELLVDSKLKEIENVLNDRAFVKTLEKLNLVIGEMVETNERYEFPILNLTGELLRVLYLDKNTGDVNIEMPDGGGSEDIASAILTLQSSGKKKIWSCPNTFRHTMV